MQALEVDDPKGKGPRPASIVDDIGGDRGLTRAESGYQSGALEAARLTNTTLASLQDLKETLAYEVGMIKLESLSIRCDSCRDRYWAIGKQNRIELGLRPDVGEVGYSGWVVIQAVEVTLHQVGLRGFPFTYARIWAPLTSIAASNNRS